MSTTDILWSGGTLSDLNVIMSGENFAEYGFMKLHFLPVHYSGPLGDTPKYYLHYPPLPNVINGLFQICGIESVAVFRIFCGSLFIIGLICMYRGLLLVLGPLASVCGIAFLATSSFFFRYGIDLYGVTYNIFYLGLFIFLFLRGIHKENAGKLNWVLCWIVLFLISLTNYEFILYCQVFAWVYVLATGRLRRRFALLVLLGLAPVAGVGLHFLQNCWAIGFSAAMADNLGFSARDGSFCVERFKFMLKMPKAVQEYSINLLHFGWPGILMMAGGVFLLRRKICSKMSGHIGPLLLSILAASASWYLFMPSHVLAHPHTAGQLLVLAMVASGGIISLMITAFFGKETSIWDKLLVGVILLVMVFNQTYRVKPNFERKRHFNNHEIVRAIGTEGLPDKAGFLYNVGLCRSSYVSYFTQRPAWLLRGYELPVRNDMIPDRGFLLKLQKAVPEDWLVKYFIFYGKKNYKDNKLFNYLTERCIGKEKKVYYPQGKLRGSLFLFDISPLHLPEQQRVELNTVVKEKQLEEIFPEWKIPGFDEYLSEQKYR